MWNTILFDLDGTLTDSQEGIINSIICALEHFGIHEERASLLEFVGPPLDESFRLRYQFSEEQIAVGIETFREYFNRRGWLENAPYPGAAELLAELRGGGEAAAGGYVQAGEYGRAGAGALRAGAVL